VVRNVLVRAVRMTDVGIIRTTAVSSSHK